MGQFDVEAALRRHLAIPPCGDDGPVCAKTKCKFWRRRYDFAEVSAFRHVTQYQEQKWLVRRGIASGAVNS
jgi:hypothetical protein